MDGLSTSAVAKRAEVNLQTLRYYERIGLVPRPPRTASRYRRYPEETINRIRFIRQAHALGFSLTEVRELLSMRASTKARCADVSRKAEMKMEDIEEKIQSLQEMRRALKHLLSACRSVGPVSNCTILSSLGRGAS